MGLLDDAIREHLDLKRARGGDPAEIEKMEREALGPVRREPPIGSTRFETGDEHAVLEPGAGYPDDRDQLLDPGYHDSTAPHPHPHHEHAGHDHLGHEDSFGGRADAQEQPKRRFLRRSRSAAPSDLSPGWPPHEEAAADSHGLFGHGDPHGLEHHDLEHHGVPGEFEAIAQHEPHEHEPLAQHEPLEHHDLSEHHESLEHHDLSEHHESLAHHDLHQPHETLAQGEPQTAPGADPAGAAPPQLQFEQPPKRPRFSPEPPSSPPETEDEPPTADRSSSVPPAPSAPADLPQDAGEVQETTEFDVQQHIAETRFQAEPETQVHRAAPAAEPPAGEEEDVLEETPEFLQDTPEHDRLWFEQRPPRDFDFDG